MLGGAAHTLSVGVRALRRPGGLNLMGVLQGKLQALEYGAGGCLHTVVLCVDDVGVCAG